MLNTCFFCLPSQPRMSQYMGNIPVTRTYRTIQSSLWVQALCCSPKQSFSCLLTCYSAAIGKCQMLQRPLLRLISVKKKWWERELCPSVCLKVSDVIGALQSNRCVYSRSKRWNEPEMKGAEPNPHLLLVLAARVVSPYTLQCGTNTNAATWQLLCSVSVFR